ncbi:MAG: hypothetical protein LBD16_04120 [Oscillospiraceae bacterium]|jgi:tetratricopeptide (TPR) repeat protein|nr:hypothetical protein [Oscillospiraceae bacterium]
MQEPRVVVKSDTANDHNDDYSRQVLSFIRSASQLHSRAVRVRREKQWYQAAELLVRALEIEPDNETILMELAKTYSEIGLSHLSNKLLLRIIAKNPAANECFYEMAINYFNMQAWGPSYDCVSLYLQASPNGSMKKDAEGLLAFLRATQNSRAEHRIQRATHAFEEGRQNLAGKLMKRAFAVSSSNGDAYAVAAFLKLSEGDAKEALDLARQALRKSSGNTRALCAVVVALNMLGNRATSESFLDKAIGAAASESELVMAIHTACEIGSYEKALTILLSMPQNEPLDPGLTHLLAVCLCHTDKIKDALPLWAKLRRLDPDDTVSDYCFEAAKNAISEGKPFLPSHVRSVPMDETLRRLSRIRVLSEGAQTGGKAADKAESGADSLLHAWQTQSELKKLVNWGLNQPEPRIMRVMLGVIRVVGDGDAQTMLRNSLLSTEHTDEFKQEMLETLFELGDPGPNYVATEKGFGAAYVQIAKDAVIVSAQDDDLATLAKSMPNIPNALEALRSIWQILLRDEGLLIEVDRWMSAAEYVVRTQAGEDLQKPERRVMRRVRRIEQLMSGIKPENSLDAFPTFEGWLDARESETNGTADEDPQDTDDEREGGAKTPIPSMPSIPSMKPRRRRKKDGD